MWLDLKEVEQLQRRFLLVVEQHHLANIYQIAPVRPSRQVEILDRSQMGHHHEVACDPCGKIDYTPWGSNF
jgi:hypothetical protein